MDTIIRPPTVERSQAIRTALSHHTGSDERTRHWARRLIYTPGVDEMAELCGAPWLIDLIASHQIDPKVKREKFQHWTLTVVANRRALAAMDDGNGKVVMRQAIEFTDFPLDAIEFYVVDDTLLLPSEY